MNFTPNSQKRPIIAQKTPPVLQKPPVSYGVRDTIFAYLCIPLCFLFVKSAPFSSSALGTMLAFITVIAFSAFYLILSGVRLSSSALTSGAVMLLLCVGFLTNPNAVQRSLLSFFLMLVLPVFVHTCCKKDFFASFSQNPVQNLMGPVFHIPANSLKTSLAAFAPKKNGKKSSVLAVLAWCAVGLVCAVIPTIVIALLLSYDEQFSNLLNRIFDFSFGNLFEYLGDGLLSVMLALPLFATLFGNLQIKKKAEVQNHNNSEEKNHPWNLYVLPKPLLAAFITPILLIYVLFFVSQWDYYVSAFTHTLPQGLTYAPYAREGFFQLCVVSGFNATFLLGFQVFMRRKPGERGILRRIYSAIISLFTLVLIATALSKLILYVDAYGMTRARVVAAWMILLLAVIFFLTLIHVFFKKFPIAIAILVTCVLFSLILFLPNIDGMIADYNVNAYLSGDLSSVDIDALSDLDYAAVPALSRLEDNLLSLSSRDGKSASILKAVTARLDALAEKSNKYPDGFFDFNIPTWRAKQMLEGRIP